MSELETMLAESASRIFANEVALAQVDAAERGEWAASLWACLEQSGLTRVFATEEQGGAAATWSEALPVLLLAAKHLAPVPFAETVVSGALLTRLRMAMPDGPMSLALPQGEVNERQEGEGWRFTGAVAAPWGRVLTHVLVPVARDGVPLWLLLPTADAKVREDTNAAAQPRDTLVFEHARAVAARVGLPGDPKLFGALQQSIQIAGVLERILNQAVQYANERVQFGRPIGKFQAIQQQLAQMANHVVAARMAVATACAAMDGKDWERQAAIAKVICGQAASGASAIAHQVHGAIGFTYEHSLHFGTRRLWSWRAEYGSDGEWAEYLGRAAIARGGKALWADLTAEG
ncbi:acyl-CoA dehydrogenase family protein [Cupriavidus alkaliphilus]|uniref:acyl-CoA dehydrogenase family protein n=1 Tax=Cupriavidus alkaliphilus TaxID=942866 RepID=UPI001618129C|nr:acyl-CoA dehydrogenase family protein [Cupriavidus alkaliphilus]MBB2919344.1 acyl-CoA dehydrogenase [Cupriavidus alkaliphilus]